MLEDRSSFIPKNGWDFMNVYGIEQLQSHTGKRLSEDIKDAFVASNARKVWNEASEDDGLMLTLGFGDFPMAPGDPEVAPSKKVCKQFDLYDDLELGLGTLLPPNIQLDSDSDKSSLIRAIGRDNTINCLIFCPRSNYASIASLNRSFRELIRSGEIYRLRRQNQVIEHWVYFSCHLIKWEAFDPVGQKWMNLPMMASSPCFQFSDKESMAVGTELLVLGKEVPGYVIYKYSLLTNSWSLERHMDAPRCLFGSASSGEIAIFAGGVSRKGKILDTVEMYNSESGTWTTLPSLLKPRKMGSGVFMDNKFYVIGGEGSDMKPLTCGEKYDLDTGKWTEIPNMSPVDVGGVSRTSAPPLIAVVNNELYAANYVKMEVKKYDKEKKEWNSIGRLPERANSMDGWGMAFRGCGERVLVIGGPRRNGDSYVHIYSWLPSEGPPNWTIIGEKRSSSFVYNCAIMGC